MDLIISVPMIVGIVYVFRKTQLIPRRFVPLFTLVVGVSLMTFFGTGVMKDLAIEGAIAALSAMGMWSGAKATVEEE